MGVLIFQILTVSVKSFFKYSTHTVRTEHKTEDAMNVFIIEGLLLVNR